jgi:hypothetical protein
VEEPRTPSARDLVRKRSRSYGPLDGSRMHHIGAAPDLVPVHTEDGVRLTRTTPWQLADRSPAQLRVLHADLVQARDQASADLEFEEAAHLQGEVEAVERELRDRS